MKAEAVQGCAAVTDPERTNTDLKSCFGLNLCEAVAIAMPAFGTGVLMAMFMPPLVVSGISALLFLGAGVVCLAAR